jgi:magnesium chelatase subunit H
MPRRTTVADRGAAPGNGTAEPAVRVVIITLDDHLACATERAAQRLAGDLPNATLVQHAAVEWGEHPEALAACLEDIARADILVVTMLFMEAHIQAVLPALEARRDSCDALVCCMSAPEVTRLTRLGEFTMNGEQSGALAFLKRFKPKPSESGSAGARQVAMLRRLPQILKWIPGKAQDVRAYFLTLQYWLSGSEANLVQMARFLVDRYAAGERATLRGRIEADAPVDYPEVGLYHPAVDGAVTEHRKDLPAFRRRNRRPRIGLVLMRSYVLAGNTAHYDGVIAALEAKGLDVVPVFAHGLDARPAIEAFLAPDGVPAIDALVSLTGFSLIGGPAYNDSETAAAVLGGLDVPYLAAHAVEFQTLDDWRDSERGLAPVEATMMVAIPELDGATGPIVYGGRGGEGEHAVTGRHGSRDMSVDPERAERLAARVERLVALRTTPKAERRLAVVIFDFPPGSGATGTAAFLGVFESLYNTLVALAADGWDVEVPADVDDLRARILEGNSARHGTDANVAARIPVDDHVRREPHLSEIEAQWGPAPGTQLTDGAGIHVQGVHLGNVFVGVQPGFGYEGDPMRLLFERGFTPTHAFSAFYRWLREDLAAHAVLHFGTHGALEFMPGKQTGMGAACWPDRLIGDLPNFYLYASNNPSEGAIAKRRSAATLISYLTPPVTRSGLYRELLELRASVDRWRAAGDDAADERAELARLIQTQAAEIDLVEASPEWAPGAVDARIAAVTAALLDIEQSLIPDGLHVVGEPPSRDARVELLELMGEARDDVRPERVVLEALVGGAAPRDALEDADDRSAEALARLEGLAAIDALLAEDHELPGLLRALDGRFVQPAPGGDLLRSPDVLPTGRNVHGFDPWRIPSAHAVHDGVKQTRQLLARHAADGHAPPEAIALVLWGTDNLKNEGAPIGQALALIGARPRFDGYGRLAGADLIPLEELGRPRIDVIMTTSGIFRDLLPLQTRLLADAAKRAAEADEPVEMNFVRKHALAHAEATGCDLATAALRVFSNADGTYGSNVNMLLDSGAWGESDELADTYTARKSFAYGCDGPPVQHTELLEGLLSHVELAYQNLESVELGVTTIDHYYDTLGGISLAAKRARGADGDLPVYIGDTTRGEGRVRTLNEQVALETRTRMLNPRWYESMLEHGHEGVRNIEASVTNTLGWSATTGQVDPWVYGQLTRTFVLDDALRERMAALNPAASLKLAERLLEASERDYWTPDAEELDALRGARESLEDRLEGISPDGVVAA